jgi:preprotein translocase subunit SecY
MTAFSDGLSDKGPTLPRRMLYTVLLLLFFRVLANVPALNVDKARLAQLLANNPLLGAVDLFAGGEVLSHFSVVAAGIFPYLLAVVLVQCATFIVPPLSELRQRGTRGQKTLDRYAKILTLPLAFIFAWGLNQYLALQTGLFPGGLHWFTASSFFPSLWIVSLVTLGSLVSTGIVHFITEKGVGAGESVVLLAGSSYGFLKQIGHIVRESPSAPLEFQRLGLIAGGGLAVIVLSTYLLQCMLKIPMQDAKRQISPRAKLESSKMYLPLMLNSGGIFPVSAAIGLLVLLQLGLGFLKLHTGGISGTASGTLSAWVASDHVLYWALLACLIVLFTYVYNFLRIWEPYGGTAPLAEGLKRNGVFVIGVRPGDRTQEYLSRTTAAITLPGALGLALLAAGLPYMLLLITKQNLLVTILALTVVVKSVYTLGGQLRYHRIPAMYEGFTQSARKRSWLDAMLAYWPGQR